MDTGCLYKNSIKNDCDAIKMMASKIQAHMHIFIAEQVNLQSFKAIG